MHFSSWHVVVMFVTLRASSALAVSRRKFGPGALTNKFTETNLLRNFDDYENWSLATSRLFKISSHSAGYGTNSQPPSTQSAGDEPAVRIVTPVESRPPPPLSSSERPGEAAKFAALAADWWDPGGPMAPLHAMNPLRARYVRNAVCRCYQLDAQKAQPLVGLSVLDVGCGAGLLSEALARMGAKVTGIDLAQRSIDVATAHCQADRSIRSRLSYKATSVENLRAQGHTFDVVTALEVIEHVDDQAGFVRSLADLTQPWGAICISTLSRTPQAYLMAILGAEYIAQLLPRGTHDWSQFITPEELTEMGRQAGLNTEHISGMTYNPFVGEWRLANDTAVNYIAYFQKPGTIRDA